MGLCKIYDRHHWIIKHLSLICVLNVYIYISSLQQNEVRMPWIYSEYVPLLGKNVCKLSKLSELNWIYIILF